MMISTESRRNQSTGEPARARSSRQRGGNGPVLQATDCDCKPGDTLLSGDRRPLALANGAGEGLQLGAQRLGMPYREMPHGITAVRLEAEALGHLPRQEVAHDVLLACCNGDVAGFERR